MPNAQSDAAKPTRVRYMVLGVTFAMAFLLYLHRFCMSYAQQYIREDLNISNDELSFCFSAFFLTYALAQVPSGWMSDRYGARMMLTIYILVWSFFTAMMGMTAGLVSLLLVRLLAGIGQAGAYPTAASLISKWIPMSSRGTASGFVSWGGRLGSGLAPVLTAALIVFFVPLDTSPLLTEDTLLDPEALTRQLEEALEAAPADPIPIAEFRNADELRSSLAVHLHEPQRFNLAGINELIELDAPLITRPLDGLPIEREARSLLKKDSLTRAEVSRVNRLVLEAAFPEAIGKLYVQGWRPVMYSYGACGIFVAAGFWFVFRNRPASHPWCNSAEQALIKSGQPEPTNSPDDVGSDTTENEKELKPLLRAIVHSRSLWLMCVSQWGSNVGWVFLVTWLPRFLVEEHSVPLVERGWMCAIPLWIGWCGMLLGGRATDVAVRRLGLKRGRVLPMMIGRFLAGGAYLLCLLHPSPWTLTALFGIVAFSTDLGSASGWAYKQDVGGNNVGSIHGWANMWGNLGATISPLLLNQIVNRYDWDVAFLVCAGAFFIAGFACMGVDASIPIQRDPSSQPDRNPTST
jgi:ACS family glucarate transporter-like MFS transporter